MSEFSDPRKLPDSCLYGLFNLPHIYEDEEFSESGDEMLQNTDFGEISASDQTSNSNIMPNLYGAADNGLLPPEMPCLPKNIDKHACGVKQPTIPMTAAPTTMTAVPTPMTAAPTTMTAAPTTMTPAPMQIATENDSSSDQKPKRFKSTTYEELKRLESATQSKATKQNTVWEMRIFEDWCVEVYGKSIDLQTICPEELASILAKFYCEARPKDTQKRTEYLPAQQAQEYHKNTLINIRGAINRHLQDIGRDLDLVRDKAFKHPNKVLEGLLKERMRNGVSRPTKHKEIVSDENLQKIATYLRGASTSPVILRHAVWYNLAIHFVTRGLEFHQQLRVNSFNFSHDEHGAYAELNHETQQKNFQGGIHKDEAPTKRMYATGAENCPVALLHLLIEKTDPSAEMLFNHYIRDTSVQSKTWYCNKPLAKRTYTTFMSDICKAANVDKKYTAHCLRATSIQRMNDSGFEARHIMSLSGHKSEAAIRSYNRSCSTAQKKSLSTTLSALANGTEQSNRNEHQAGGVLQIRDENRQLTPSNTRNVSEINDNNPQINNSIMSTTMASFSAGFMSNATFQNCTLNFHMSK